MEFFKNNLFLVYVLVLPFVFVRIGYDGFMLPKIIYFAFTFLLIASFFFIFRKKNMEVKEVHVVMGVFLAVSLLSVAINATRFASLKSYFEIFIVFLLAFFLSNSAKDDRTRRFFLSLVAVANSGVIVFYVFQKTGLLDFFSYAGFGNKDYLAGYAVITVPVIAYLALSAKAFAGRAFFAVLFFADMYLLISAKSRGGLVAFATAVLFIFFVKFFSGRMNVLKSAAIAAGVIAVVSVLFFTPARDVPVIQDLSDSVKNIFKLREKSNLFRIYSYQSIARIIRDNPFFGNGCGSFPVIYTKYRIKEVGESIAVHANPRYAHNDYLQFGSESGLFGLGAFLLIILYVYKTQLSMYGAKKDEFSLYLLTGMTGFLTHMAFDFPFYRPETQVMFFTYLGILTSGRTDSMAEVKSFALPVYVKIACFILVVIAGISILNPQVADVESRQGRELENARQWESAEIFFRKALLLHKNEMDYPTHLGIVLDEQGVMTNSAEKYREAIKYLEYAVKIAPYHSINQYNLGRAYLKASDVKSALRHLKMASRLDENAYQYHNELGLVYKNIGQYRRAVREYQIAVGEYGNPPAVVNMAKLYTDLNYYDSAIQFVSEHLEDKSANIDYYLCLGIAHHKKGEYGNAIDTYKKALEIEPKNIQVRVNLAASYYVSGDLQSAVREYGRVIELDGNSSLGMKAKEVLAGMNR